jgi:acyl dehydratase
MQFAEFKIGAVLTSGRRQVTESEIIEFAARYDPQWFHVDSARAESSHWHGIIASGWMTCSIAMQLAVSSVLQDSDSIGSPGVDYVKWPYPLRPGDEVQLRMEIIEARVSRSGRRGVLRWRWVLTTHRLDTVLDLTATSLFELQPMGDERDKVCELSISTATSA